MKLETDLPSGTQPTPLYERIAELRADIARTARACGRDPDAIRLVGVTKRQAREDVIAAIEAGLMDVGENYVQEARDKYEGLPPVRKHFLGHLQTNKARHIVATFDVVQSVDRLDAGRAIARACSALQKPVSVLVQVNISPTDRFGIAPEAAPELAERLRCDEGLVVDGVMAIAPNTDDRAEITRAFERARRAFESVGGSTLSLGMSGDWNEAIACGSTMVRIGTAIFGART